MKKEKEIRVCSCGNIFKSNHYPRIYCDQCLKKIKSHKYQRDGNGGLKPRMTIEEYIYKMKNGLVINGMKGKSVLFCLIKKYGEKIGKERYEEMKKKQKETYKNNCLTEEQKNERIRKTVHYGSSNGMYGRTFYDVWVQKYGKEQADKKMIEYKNKHSELSRGKNNPMYGKPAPKGSGNGISGWYKGWYFRSLRELSYMIQVIEKEGHEWRSLDNTSDFRIKYIDKENHERSYCPDFLIDNKIIVQIKPQKLQKIDNVLRKENAAILFCKMRNLQYLKTDVDIIDFSKINEMVENKIIIFTNKSLIKFNNYKSKIQRRIKNESK